MDSVFPCQMEYANTNNDDTFSFTDEDSITLHDNESAFDAISMKPSSPSQTSTTWILFWENYPLNYSEWLQYAMNLAPKFFIQPERDHGIPYIFGLFLFKLPVQFLKLEAINNKLTLHHFTNLMQWRIRTVNFSVLREFCINSVKKDGPCHHKNYFVLGPRRNYFEDIVAVELKKFEMTRDLIHNAVITNHMGCLKRPDFHGYIGNNQFIIIEVDEHQHSGYDKIREEKRLFELYEVVKEELNQPFLIVIRFNPHYFVRDRPGKRRVSITINQKISYLISILREIYAMSFNPSHSWRNQFQGEGIYALFLYYDGFQEISAHDVQFDFFPLLAV